MKIIKESKEKLPGSFAADFISQAWSQIGMLKAEIKSITSDYKGGKEIAAALGELVDAYLICVGKLQGFMDKTDYAKVPEADLKESLKIQGKTLQEILDFLINDENEAIDGYLKAKEGFKSLGQDEEKPFIDQFDHIIGEEYEHIDELIGLKKLLSGEGEEKPAETPVKEPAPIEEPAPETPEEPAEELPEEPALEESAETESDSKIEDDMLFDDFPEAAKADALTDADIYGADGRLKI